MNDFYHRQNRYLREPLYAAQTDKREINKKLKKVRENIDYHARSLGSSGNDLTDLEKQLDQVNDRIDQLKKEEN